MSNDAVVEFMKKVDGDPGLQETLDRALDDEERAVESFLGAAAEQGFRFTADEFLETVRGEDANGMEGELSDDQLEAVAGGLSFAMPTTRRIVRRAFRRIGSYRTGLGIRGIGPADVMQEVQEEEDVQT